MRRKALLVGAKAGVVGPAVTLEDGIWEVESHPFVSVHWPKEAQVTMLKDRIRILGRARIVTEVHKRYVGPPIHLDAVQIEGPTDLDKVIRERKLSHAKSSWFTRVFGLVRLLSYTNGF
jgi:hypothetical protein